MLLQGVSLQISWLNDAHTKRRRGLTVGHVIRAWSLHKVTLSMASVFSANLEPNWSGAEAQKPHVVGTCRMARMLLPHLSQRPPGVSSILQTPASCNFPVSNPDQSMACAIYWPSWAQTLHLKGIASNNNHMIMLSVIAFVQQRKN